MIYKTGSPLRANVPSEDFWRWSFVASNARSACPYKGEARYLSVAVDGRVLEDVAWSYDAPLREAEAIAGLVSFDGESVEVQLADR